MNKITTPKCVYDLLLNSNPLEQIIATKLILILKNWPKSTF
jgi:hypothetical protein